MSAALLLGLESSAMKTHDVRNVTKRKKACRETARSCAGERAELCVRRACRSEDVRRARRREAYLKILRRFGSAMFESEVLRGEMMR